MSKRNFLGALFLSSLTSFIYSTDFCFVNGKDHWNFETDFAAASNAKFYKPDSSHNSKMQYAEGTTSIFYNHFVSENNALAYQIGMNYTHLGWNQNPRFSGQDYYYGIASIAWVSYAIERWRWVINTGVSFDAEKFDVGNSGVYYTLLWGRYQYTSTFAMHVGFLGYYGAAKNGYMLPVLGCDWWWSNKWEYKIIFPLETSVHYHFNNNWSTAIMFTTFGGPYRFPRRILGGREKYENGIFEIYSTGIELDMKYKASSCLKAGVGGGCNFGGWILIKDHANHHGRYYKFNASAYGRAYLTFSF